MNQTLSLSLKESWDNRTVTFNQNDPGSRPFTYVPALWEKEESFLSYGGTQTNSTTSDSLWEFLTDGNGGGAWVRREDPDGSVHDGLNGAACSSAGEVGYCYGGYSYDYKIIGSGNNTSYKLNFDLSPGIVSYDWSSDTWANNTAQLESYTVMNAASQMIPDLGSKGLFMSWGGSHIMGWNIPETSIQLDQSPVTMNKIAIYDPDSNTWYSQPTTGVIPPSRIGACSVLAKSTTGSYEIFVYGGAWEFTDGPDSFTYYDAYVLTVPGFEWFPVSSPDATNPGRRIWHTCNLVGNSQALVFGGYNFLNDTSTQFQDTDPWTQGLGVFDMTTLKWKDSYDADAPEYESPQQIQEWYSSTKPTDVKWASDDLKALFQVEGSSWFSENGQISASVTSSSSSGSSTNAGAIAGGVVGGVIGLLLILFIAWALVRRRRGLPIYGKRNKSPENGGYSSDPKVHPGGPGDTMYGQKAELPGNEPVGAPAPMVEAPGADKTGQYYAPQGEQRPMSYELESPHQSLSSPKGPPYSNSPPQGQQQVAYELA